MASMSDYVHRTELAAYVPRAELEDLDAEIRGHKISAHRKMMALYLALIFGIVLFLYAQGRSDQQDQKDNQHFQQSIIQVCNTVRENTANLNKLIDAITTRVNTSPDATPEQKKQFTALYQSAKGALPECPPGP
jgi:uncharacterized protein HemX